LWITNKKSELMLMRHARAYNSSCSQIISVYLHPFRCNSLFRSRKWQKKSQKTPIFKVQGHSMSSILILLKSTSSVLVMINNTSVPICNRFHDRQANSGKITTFWRGTLVWHPRAQASLNVLCPDFKVKATVNDENFMCIHFISLHFILVYVLPFRRNLLLKCVSQPEIAKNSPKLPILEVQGHLRSSMLTFLRSSSPVIVMISRISVPIFNHFLR